MNNQTNKPNVELGNIINDCLIKNQLLSKIVDLQGQLINEIFFEKEHIPKSIQKLRSELGELLLELNDGSNIS